MIVFKVKNFEILINKIKIASNTKNRIINFQYNLIQIKVQLILLIPRVMIAIFQVMRNKKRKPL